MARPGTAARWSGVAAPASWPAGPHAEVARRCEQARWPPAAPLCRGTHASWPRNDCCPVAAQVKVLCSLSCSPSPSLVGTGMDIDLGLLAQSSLLVEAPGGSDRSGASMIGSVVLPSDLRRSPIMKLPEAKGGGGMVDDRGPVMALETTSYVSAPGAPPPSAHGHVFLRSFWLPHRFAGPCSLFLFLL